MVHSVTFQSTEDSSDYKPVSNTHDVQRRDPYPRKRVTDSGKIEFSVNLASRLRVALVSKC